MLRLADVSVGYGEGDIVKNVSLTLAEGDCLSIIGPNGCGKTTLLKAIAGMLPYSGDIEISGRSARGMSRNEYSQRIAMLGQAPGIYFSYSVYDTVMMGRYPYIKGGLIAKPSQDDARHVLSCLEAVNLAGDADREITKLSGGQLQRVFLARTLAQDPAIILLDEPTNHLDLKYQIELIEHLKAWSKQDGHAVIGVLHDINLALRLGERLMVMNGGRLSEPSADGKAVTGELINNVYGVDVTGYMLDALENWKRIV